MFRTCDGRSLSSWSRESVPWRPSSSPHRSHGPASFVRSEFAEVGRTSYRYPTLLSSGSIHPPMTSSFGQGKAIQLVEGDGPVKQCRVRPALEQLAGSASKEPEGGIGSARSEAESLHAQPLEFCYRRETRTDHDVHREIQCTDESRDRCRVGQAHWVDTIGPGVSVGDPPPDGFFEPGLIISLRVTERVRAGVDHEGDRLGLSERSEGLQFLQLFLERSERPR